MMVIMPTRPININTDISTLLFSPRSGVMFKLEPTVPIADTVSNNNPNEGIPGSIITSAIKNNVMVMIEPNIVAEALFTEFDDISLFKTITLSRPRTTDLKFENATAKVLTFIPPAVD